MGSLFALALIDGHLARPSLVHAFPLLGSSSNGRINVNVPVLNTCRRLRARRDPIILDILVELQWNQGVLKLFSGVNRLHLRAPVSNKKCLVYHTMNGVHISGWCYANYGLVPGYFCITRISTWSIAGSYLAACEACLYKLKILLG